MTQTDIMPTSPDMEYPPTAYGAFQRMRTWLFGPIQHRLAEEPGEIHPLSYLLIAAQSLTVLFVFAHQQIVQMLTAPWTIKIIAGLVSFVLVITVIAADMCVAYSWRRIPPLRRNREDGMVWEHWLYILFVLALEGTTFAVVIATLENAPDALLSARPVIDAGTWLWRVMVAARLVTVGWTTLQLLIVKSKVPVQWTTLMGTAAEVLGGHAQHLMLSLNVRGHDLARVVNAYAAATKPRRRFPTTWNTNRVAKEAWHEQRENEQRDQVLAALRDFEPQRPAPPEPAPEPASPVRTQDIAPVRTQADATDNGDDDRPPTGPGTPVKRSPVRTPRESRQEAAPYLQLPVPPEWRERAARGAKKSPVRTPRRTRRVVPVANYETQALAAWANGAKSVKKMEIATGMGHTAAQSWVRTLKAAEAAARVEMAGQTRQEMAQ